MENTNSKKLRPPIRVVVTGAAGRVAYMLLYLIARGEVFGEDQPVNLNLFEVPKMCGNVRGVMMELTDAVFPLLRRIKLTSNPATAFKDVSAAFLSSSRLYGKGHDHLRHSVEMFRRHGEALNEYAHKDVKVVVISNPANTLAYICMLYAPTIPPENFSSMARLDHNRAKNQIAKKLGVQPINVRNVIAWGKHSPEQIPDAKNATVVIKGTTFRVWNVVKNAEIVLQKTLADDVLHREKTILAAHHSSTLATANAAAIQMHDWWHGTGPGRWVSMGVLSDGSYELPKDIFFAFPVQISNKQWTIVKNLNLTNYIKLHILNDANELCEQKIKAIKYAECEYEEEQEEEEEEEEEENEKPRLSFKEEIYS